MRNSIMKKRIMAVAASAVMSVTAITGAAGTVAAPLLGSMTNSIAAEASVKINATVGYAEGMYATWGAVSGATGYNVYVDGVQIDSMLIRQYSGYMRADAIGLKAGSHTMKVVPVINGSEDSAKAASGTASVYAHDRSGYAFADGHVPGAYKADGTLKDNAIVVYVTEDTKDTVTASLNAEGDGNVECKGIQNIVTAYKKGKETRPISIRLIGNITDPANMPKGDLMVDTVTSAGMTIEGIGSDATANGWGIVLKNSVDVEVRNLGTMNCNSSEGDNIGLQQSDSYCWIHNCDFFYGDAGSDADQVKGDGALDTKKSHHITHSYNHFYDNGKCNLQGANTSDTSNYITYHHNWYDHSDSRHPRVRVATVHVYNNYYDGNAKYGIGSTTDSDIFAENNYFRNCSKPMMISGQGTDAAGEGTFSGEDGGMIKAYGNIFEGGTYVPYSSNNTQFDFYDAKSRTEAVPSSVKAAQGGAGYSNFDTASGFYSYNVDAAADVPSIVTAKAGRVDGGDFKWDFDNAKEDPNYDVIPELKAALVAYDDSIVSIGSGFKEDVSNPPTTTPQQTTPQQTAPPQTPPVTPGVTGGQIHNFTESEKSSSFYTITGNMKSGATPVSYGGMTLSKALKMESATSISFNAGSSGLLTLVTDSPSMYIKIDGEKYKTGADGTLALDLDAGAHTITKGDTMNLYYISFGGKAGTPVVTTPPVTTQGGITPIVTNVTTPAPVVPSGNISVVYAGGWNEMAYLVCSGLKDANVTGVSYTGASSGKLTGDDLKYLVRDVNEGVRVDLLGLKPGTYSITLETTAGNVTQPGIVVGEQDRSGFAHYNYTDGVGAYNDDGTLKEGAKVLYITNDNKDTVSITSKDGTTVTGIGNILNSAGMDSGNGKTANGGTPNSNSGIIKKIAQDGTPLVIRIVGNVETPKGVTEFDSVNYGGSVGDNGGMARMKSGKNVTIEGVGNDATINGWGIHFMCESAAPELGKSFEVRNIAFRNVPEDCIGMEGVQEGSGHDATLIGSVERCWVHNCEFYVPSIANPAESDKGEGDGACDFKRGQYFTNSYCYYEGYHKTNLVGSSGTSIQYHLTYHHNYWKNCESRGPLSRQADIHMYNNVFDGQTSYCENARAAAFIFSEYNAFVGESKDPFTVKDENSQGIGVIKSYNDALISIKKGSDNQAVTVTDKSQKVDSRCKYANFDTDASVSYIPSGAYSLTEKTGEALYTDLNSIFEELGGCMDNKKLTTTPPVTEPGQSTPVTTTPQPIVTTTPAPISGLPGDANDDGSVDIADATLVLQHVGNSDKYPLSAKEAALADVAEPKGINVLDSLEIQKYDAKVVDKLTMVS